MYCGKCGSLINDGERFCGRCGAPVIGASAAAETNAAAAGDMNPNGAARKFEPAEVNTQQQYGGQTQQYGGQSQQYGGRNNTYNGTGGHIYVDPDPNGYGYNAGGEQKPKSKKKFIIGGIVAALVIAVGIVAALAVKNGWFLSGDNKMKSLGKEKISGILADINSTMKDIGIKKDSAVEVTVEPGQYLTNLASSKNIDLSWLNEVKLKLASDSKDDVSGIRARLSLNDVEIACLDVLIDAGRESLLVGLDGLSDEYGFYDLSQSMGLSSLPVNLDNDKLTKLLEKYTGLFFDSLEKTDKYKDELTAGGVTETCTVYEAKLSERQLYQIAEKLLTEAREDKELAELFSDFAPAVMPQRISLGSDENSADNTDMQKAYTDYIDNVLKTIGEKEADASDETMISFFEFVSGNEVTGFGLANYNNEGGVSNRILFGTAHDGDRFGTELKVNDTVYLTGNGTQKGNILNGNIQLVNGKESFVSIKLTDFDKKKREGVLELSMSQDVWYSLGVDSTTAAAVSAGVVRAEISSGKIVLDVMLGAQSVAKLTLSSASGENISLDTNGSTVDINEWPQTIDLNTLRDRLEDAGVPENILKRLFGTATSVN